MPPKPVRHRIGFVPVRRFRRKKVSSFPRETLPYLKRAQSDSGRGARVRGHSSLMGSTRMAPVGHPISHPKQVMQSSRKVTRAFAPQVMQRMLSFSASMVSRPRRTSAKPSAGVLFRSLRGALSTPSPGRFSATRRVSSRSLCRCAPCMRRSMEMAASRPQWPE